MQRWVVIARVGKELTAMDTETFRRRRSGSGPRAIQRQVQGLQCVLALLQSWQDPFSSSIGSLINIAYGVVVTDDVRKDLLTGQDVVCCFVVC